MKNVVFSRKGKINHKYLESIEVGEDNMVIPPNVIHVSWDKGEAYVSVTDNLFKAVQYATDNPQADFIKDLVNTFRKLCKVKKFDELFFAAVPGFKMERQAYEDEADIPEALPGMNRLDFFDKSVNQVDRLFNNDNFMVAAMVDNKTGKVHKFND